MDQGKKKWERHLLDIIPCTESELRKAADMTDEELAHFLWEKKALNGKGSREKGDFAQ